MCKRISLVTGWGGEHFSKTFSISYMLNTKNRVFNPYFYCEKILLRIGVEPAILFMEQISFSLKIFSDYFYGQNFIKTARGPFLLS